MQKDVIRPNDEDVVCRKSKKQVYFKTEINFSSVLIINLIVSFYFFPGIQIKCYEKY